MSRPRRRASRADGRGAGLEAAKVVRGRHGATRRALGPRARETAAFSPVPELDPRLVGRGRGDPATMSPEARLSELGAFLARGYRRMLQKRLAESGDVEALCDPAVDGDGAGAAEEDAR